MSKKTTKKSTPEKSKGNKVIIPSTLAFLQEEMMKMQESPLLEEIKKVQANARRYQEIFREIGLTQQRLQDSVSVPMSELAKSLKTVGAFQSSIFDSIQATSAIQNIAKSQLAAFHDVLEKTALHSSLLDIANSFKSLQIEAFAGLIIKSDFQEQISRIHNGIREVSLVESTQVLQGGTIKLGIKKDTSSEYSTQIVYKKVESIQTYVQLMGKDLTTTKDDVQMIKEMLITTGIVQLLQDNPFPYFRIRKIHFNRSSSNFLINNLISIIIPSKTLQDYLCQVLFSGYKESITEEWDYDDIIEKLEILMGEAESGSLTWKKLQEAVSNINNKIAIETTIKDVVQIPRTETIQLNSRYFN